MDKSTHFGELRRRILVYFNTMADFAESLNISSTSLSNKLNRKTPWRLDEITEACKVLEISTSEVPFYFLDKM